MTRAAFTIAVAFLCAAATSPPVTCESPCECRDNHGKGRWAVKNDASTPPADASAIQSVTPSDVCDWPGIDVRLTWQSERTGIENKWFAVTVRVVAVKVEADGDLHLALQDASGERRDTAKKNVLALVRGLGCSLTLKCLCHLRRSSHQESLRNR